MTYKAYPNQKSTPLRMTRKQMRRNIFVFNKKAAKARRKAIRLERKSLEIEE